MNFLPSSDPDALGLGPVAALAVLQIAAGFLIALPAAALPGSSSALSAAGGLIGAMLYSFRAETKAPGRLPPRVAWRLALRVSVLQIAIASPFLAFLALSTQPQGEETLPPVGWLAIVLFAGVFTFLTTWLGLVLGRRIGAKTRQH